MKILRLKMRYTQKELASRIGVDQSYISRIERGIIDGLTIKKLVKLSNVLQVTPMDLLERLLNK